MRNTRSKHSLFPVVIAAWALFASWQFASAPRALAADAQAKSTVFYVSRAGSDAWSGRLAAPNATGTDGPFATLTRARDAVRSLPARGRKPVSVYVRGGVYTLNSPLVFQPEDSGTEKSPITYAAYQGEKVVVSGGRAITGWKKATEGEEETGPELWRAEVPGVKEGEWYFRQLFVGDERRQRARSPNTGFYRADGIFEAGDPAHFRFHPGDIRPTWNDGDDVELVGLEKWGEFRLFIKAVDARTNTATLSGQRQDYGDDKNARYWIENTRDALDAPGEWYLDRQSGTLFYIALPGEDVGLAQFMAPALPQLIRFEGKADAGQFVHDLVLRGFSFEHTDWSLPPKGYADMQAAYDIPAAVELIAARHCRIEQCTFTHLGQYAVEIHQGSQDDQVVGNEMTDLCAGGVKVGDTAIPKTDELETKGIVVSENHIHDIAKVYLAAIGVWIGQSSGNTVAHNEISDTYYTGISLGWTWGYGPSAAHDNRIEYNHIYNIGRGMLSDMGCIYSLGVQPGTVERYNLCHDVSRFQGGYGGWGIYTDEGSSHILIENNVVYRTEDAGFHQHYGQENILRNNIFALGQNSQIRRSRKEDHQSFSFEHNLVYWTEGVLLDAGGKWDDQFLFDNNLYYQAGGQPIVFGKESMADWQKAGQDVHSIVVDPLFVDPDHGDFTLKPGSPAAKIGFQPIDMSQMGRTTAKGD
jgi:parallel beta-helix repeat protein